MISPKLSILMVAMSVVGAVSPMAAMAQDTVTNALDVSNTAAQVADTSADDNVEVNDADVSQSNQNEAECEDDCEASVEARDQIQFSNVERENSIETGDVEQEQEEIEQANSLEDVDAIAIGPILCCSDPDCLQPFPCP
jgi:hypothetical protein